MEPVGEVLVAVFEEHADDFPEPLQVLDGLAELAKSLGKHAGASLAPGEAPDESFSRFRGEEGASQFIVGESPVPSARRADSH
jgi:hypothetical protein